MIEFNTDNHQAPHYIR